MDINGRAEYIEDYLVQLHTGQWFGWKNVNNKIYSNLIILDDSKTKPTKKQCTDGLKSLQNSFDNKEYSRNRQKDYPSLADQLDDIFHNGIESWKANIQIIKDKYPKD